MCQRLCLSSEVKKEKPMKSGPESSLDSWQLPRAYPTFSVKTPDEVLATEPHSDHHYNNISCF